MTKDIIIAILGVVGLLSVAIIKEYGPFNRSRAEIQKDIEIHSALPSTSRVKDQLREVIDRRIERSIIGDSSLERDPFGIVLAIIFIIGSLSLGWYSANKGGWWYMATGAAVFLFLLGVAGFGQDAVKRDRSKTSKNS